MSGSGFGARAGECRGQAPSISGGRWTWATWRERSNTWGPWGHMSRYTHYVIDSGHHIRRHSIIRQLQSSSLTTSSNMKKPRRKEIRSDIALPSEKQQCNRIVTVYNGGCQTVRQVENLQLVRSSLPLSSIFPELILHLCCRGHWAGSVKWQGRAEYWAWQDCSVCHGACGKKSHGMPT